MTENLCGSCTLCCKIMAVDELQKPRNQWCGHCDKGRGCKIYDERPQSCRDFECVWLLSQKHDPAPPSPLPPELRPDRSKVVLAMSTSGKALIAHVDPGYPTAWREGPMARFLDAMIANDVPVIVAVGEKRTWLSREHGILDVPMDESVPETMG